MKRLMFKSHVIFGLLLLCGISGILSGCGREDVRQIENESAGQFFSIGEELQWESCFGWQYFSLDEDTNGEKTGYFIQEKNLETDETAISEAENDRQDGNIIVVCHDMLSEEELFVLINSHIGELTDQYPDNEVVCRINGSTEIDQFVQLDADQEHWLYIRSEDSVYILYGEKMNDEEWQEFLREWLFTSGLQWNGLMVMKADGTVADTYTGYKRDEGIRRMFQYGEACIEFDGDTLLFHGQEDGFYFKIEKGDEEESVVTEVVLRSADICLKFDSFEEAVPYFADRYPDMYSLEMNLYGENTLWNYEEGMLDQIFYKVEEPESSHGFFLQNGEVYEVFSQGEPGYYSMADTVRSSMGYDYMECFSWKQEEDGSIAYEDNLAGTYFYIRNWGGEKILRFQAEIIEKTEGELLNNYIYRVGIFDEERNEFLQEIEVDSSYAHKSPFKFEDFNADGYEDLTVSYYYGANGGTASHYIFSPSRKEFVKVDSELDYYGMYSVDDETRRLYMHYHGSAIDGIEITYQWKNEMDYEIVKQYDHEWTDDGVWVKIVRYENGEIEILSDYLYSFEEYAERNDIWGTYYEDFIWEKEVTDRTTGKKYMIRYAEPYMAEISQRTGETYYEGRIYVYDEDTYLVRKFHTEHCIPAVSIDIEDWETDDGDREQSLVVRYDNGMDGYYLAGLFRPDYQPGSQ